MSFYCSVSFNVIDCFRNRKPIYDFILVINCELSAVSHRFLNIAPRSKTHLSLVSSINVIPSNFIVALMMYCAIFSKNHVVLASVILSQYTRANDDDYRRQTTITERCMAKKMTET